MFLFALKVGPFHAEAMAGYIFHTYKILQATVCFRPLPFHVFWTLAFHVVPEEEEEEEGASHQTAREQSETYELLIVKNADPLPAATPWLCR